MSSSRRRGTGSEAYRRLERRWEQGEVRILDGGVGSELERAGATADHSALLARGLRGERR